jgi:hypothetical protein
MYILSAIIASLYQLILPTQTQCLHGSKIVPRPGVFIGKSGGPGINAGFPHQYQQSEPEVFVQYVPAQ